MTWIATLAVGIAVLLTLGPVPLWAKLLGISAAAVLLVLGIARDVLRSASWKPWIRRYRFFLTVIPLLIFLNGLCRVYDHAWDLSQIQFYSLRQESAVWLSKMRAPVTAYIFLRSDNKTAHYVTWLQESAARLGAPLTIEVHNINRDVMLADRYGVNKAGETVLTAGDRWIKVPDFKESSIVAGLAKLFSREGSEICFLSGHGEPDVTSETSEGLQHAAAALQTIGYGVRSINLMDGNEKVVASQCAILAMMGPHSEFFPNEIDRLRALWGTLPILVAADLPTPTSLLGLLKEKGVTLGGHLLMQPDNVERKIPTTDLSVDVGSSPLVLGLRGVVFLPRVQSVVVESNQWPAVLSTSPTQGIIEEGTTVGNPFAVAVAADAAEGTSRILVLGSGRAFLNANWGFANNAQFFLQSNRWLINEDAVHLPPDMLVKEPIMDLSGAQIVWINTLVFYMIPGGILLLCLFLWWRHRWA